MQKPFFAGPAVRPCPCAAGITGKNKTLPQPVSRCTWRVAARGEGRTSLAGHMLDAYVIGEGLNVRRKGFAVVLFCILAVVSVLHEEIYFFHSTHMMRHANAGIEHAVKPMLCFYFSNKISSQYIFYEGFLWRQGAPLTHSLASDTSLILKSLRLQLGNKLSHFDSNFDTKDNSGTKLSHFDSNIAAKFLFGWQPVLNDTNSC